MALLYPPSSLLHYLCTDIPPLTYLLSSLFFPRHTSRILVSTILLPGLFTNHNIISKQHRPRRFSANRNGLNADPWCSPSLILKLSVVPTAVLHTSSLFRFARTYPVQVAHTFPNFLIQYHSSSRGTLL